MIAGIDECLHETPRQQLAVTTAAPEVCFLLADWKHVSLSSFKFLIVAGQVSGITLSACC